MEDREMLTDKVSLSIALVYALIWLILTLVT